MSLNKYTFTNKDGSYEVFRNNGVVESGMGEMTEEGLADIKNNYDFQEIYYNDLGMCGCGRPDEVKDFIGKFLSNIDVGSENRLKANSDLITATDPDIIFEIIGHVIERAGLIEHGGSVYGSWTTDKGF